MQIILWSLRRSASGKRAMPFRKQGCNAKPSAGRALESQRVAGNLPMAAGTPTLSLGR